MGDIMNFAISEYLPMAFGVALSPMPIIAMIILTVIGAAKSKGTAFLFGWFIAIIAFMVFVVILGDQAGAGSESDPSVWSIILQFAFAFLLLFLAWNSWKKRPKKGEEPKEPGWISKLGTMSTPAVFALGMGIAILNVKNLPIIASSAIIIAQAHSTWASGLIDAAVFALIASIGVGLPWAISLIGGEKMKPTLEAMRDWLYQYNNIIMMLLFGFLGINALSAALALVL